MSLSPQVCAHCGAKIYSGLKPNKCPVCGKPWKEKNPIRHTKKGWFWGSVGPQPTRKALLQQIRAIYAGGYKGRNPLTLLEKQQLKNWGNIQHGISMRYQSVDPVRSEHYHGRSVAAGKIARQFNPTLTIPTKTKNPNISKTYQIDNSISISENMNWVNQLVGKLPSGVFTGPIALFGGGGKYGKSIKGMKGVTVFGYYTISTPGRRFSSKDIRVSKRILAKDNQLNIEKIREAVNDIYSRTHNPTLSIPIESKKQLGHLFKAQSQLSKAGVTFDSGTQLKPKERHWELDYSLKGAKMKNPKRQLSVPEKHQLAIAKKTLTYSDVGARIMGSPTKAEAREIIKRLTGRTPKDNPTAYYLTDKLGRTRIITKGKPKPKKNPDWIPMPKAREIVRFFEGAYPGLLKKTREQVKKENQEYIKELESRWTRLPSNIASIRKSEYIYRWTAGRLLRDYPGRYLTVRKQRPKKNPIEQSIGNILGGLGILSIPLFIGGIIWLQKKYGP